MTAAPELDRSEAAMLTFGTPWPLLPPAQPTEAQAATREDGVTR